MIPTLDPDDLQPSQTFPKPEFFYDEDKPLLMWLGPGVTNVLMINLAKLIDEDTGKIKVEAVNAAVGVGISSDPSNGGKPITNAYVGSDGKLRVDYED